VTRFGRSGDTLAVEISNPNTEFGLVREAFEIAAVAADGSIIKVLGKDGLLGAVCCTIYHLPPGGLYAFSFALPPAAPQVAKVELTIPRPTWVKWADVKPAKATVSNATASGDTFSTIVTGRVAIDQPQALNVVVIAEMEDPAGALVFVVAGAVDCVTSDPPRAFEIRTSFAKAPAGAAIKRTFAYPTAVAGAGTNAPPPPACGR